MVDSLDSGTPLANRCRLIYPEARDATLELHPWNFASARAWLTQSEVTPAFGWQYQYLLPTGVGSDVPPYCLVVRGTDLDPGGPRWEVGSHPIDGRVLWSDMTPVGITYTGRVENLSAWNALARQVLVKVLGSKLAQTKALGEAKMKEAFALLPVGQHRDDQEGTPMQLRPNRTLITARYRTRGAWTSTSRGTTWPW